MGLLAACAAFAASTAAAQESSQIPFAPPIPSTFIVDQVATANWTDDGVTRTGTVHARYTLQMRGEGSAVWTVTSAETTGALPPATVDLAIWIGAPIGLTLSEAGRPITVADWESTRQAVYAAAQTHRRTTLDDATSEEAAGLLATALVIIAPCHNTNLTVGEPVQTRREHASLSTYFETSKELQVIDRSSQTARIRFERVDGRRGMPGGLGEGPPSRVTNTRVDCIVDLTSGVTQSAVAVIANEVGTPVEVRSEISITRQ